MQWLFLYKQKIHPKIHMECQETPNSHNNLEKDEQYCRTHISWLQNLLQSYSIQKSMVME